MINYGYFRHRFDSHNNPKLNNLVDDIGLVAYAYYYTLIELYGSKYADKNEDGFVDIHIRVISNTWRKRVDSCDKVLTKLQLSGLLVYTKLENTCSISIPNFAKYYGSYKKKTTPTPPNKSKVNKSKVKGKTTPIVKKKISFNEKVVALFQDQEIISWLKKADNKKVQDELMLKFKETFLLEEIKKAYFWKEENNKPRKAGAFLLNWCEKSFDKNKYNDAFNPALISLNAAEEKLLNL